jgi:hypothetical protein
MKTYRNDYGRDLAAARTASASRRLSPSLADAVIGGEAQWKPDLAKGRGDDSSQRSRRGTRANRVNTAEGLMISLRVRRQEANAVVEVIDQGPGIAPEHQ